MRIHVHWQTSDKQKNSLHYASNDKQTEHGAIQAGSVHSEQLDVVEQLQEIIIGKAIKGYLTTKVLYERTNISRRNTQGRTTNKGKRRKRKIVNLKFTCYEYCLVNINSNTIC